MMEFDDISDASFGERHHSYMDNFAGKDINRRAEVYDLAHMAASEEMLDEIHAMLRELLKRTA